MDNKNICALCYYKVIQYCEGSSYISTDWEGDSKFEDYSFKEEYSLQGCEILKIFAERLNDDNLIDFTISDKRYVFDYFNPNNGSTYLITYVIKRNDQNYDYRAVKK